MMIYAAAFNPKDAAEAKRQRPSPGWCWERTSEEMRAYARRQADFALAVVMRRRHEL